MMIILIYDIYMNMNLDQNYIISGRTDRIDYILEYVLRLLTSYLHLNPNNIEYIAKYTTDNENDQDYIDSSIYLLIIK